MAKNSKKISKFIVKLLEILEGSKYDQLIRWGIDGTGVQIINRKQLQSQVLIEHFKLKKFSSFIRQLHLYGFSKSKNSRKTNIYQHPLFVQNSGQNYHLIKRKYKQKEEEFSKSSFETQSIIEEKKEKKETSLPYLFSIKSLQNIFKSTTEQRTCSNEVFFQEWFMNEEDEISLLLDDCLN